MKKKNTWDNTTPMIYKNYPVDGETKMQLNVWGLQADPTTPSLENNNNPEKMHVEYKVLEDMHS